MSPNEQVEISPREMVRSHIAEYESSGGTADPHPSGKPIIVLTYRGAKSGLLRKTALMKVEDGGRYALVASIGGRPTNPAWYHCLKVHPEVAIQDGAEPHGFVVHEAAGDERAKWWRTAVTAYPPYAEYQERTTRLIPVFVAEPV